MTLFCASHKTKKSHRQNEETAANKKLLSRINSNITSKAQSMVKMISWKKLQVGEVAEEEGGDHDGDDDDEVLWRKTIMMGERCRPLDFSGKIQYDSEGNLLPAAETDRSGQLVSSDKW